LGGQTGPACTLRAKEERWFRVQGFEGVRFRVQGPGCRVQGAGCRMQGAGCRMQGSRV